jgi:hypothetical protein
VAGGALSARPALRRSAFTLAEVLAALAFMAIVIPVAIHAMHIAGLAGQVAERKSTAALVAQRVLNESVVTTNWVQSSLNGTAYEGDREFEWVIRNDNWTEGQMRLLTVEVNYTAQGRPYSVRLSTLVDGAAPYGEMTALP